MDRVPAKVCQYPVCEISRKRTGAFVGICDDDIFANTLADVPSWWFL